MHGNLSIYKQKLIMKTFFKQKSMVLGIYFRGVCVIILLAMSIYVEGYINGNKDN